MSMDLPPDDPDATTTKAEDDAFFDAWLSRHTPTQLQAFRRSLDEAEAEADRDGWLSHEEVFSEIHARLEAREATRP